jgi:gas vesicle protein
MIIGFIVGCVVGFAAGILVGRKNKKGTEKIIADLKVQLDQIKK